MKFLRSTTRGGGGGEGRGREGEGGRGAWSIFHFMYINTTLYSHITFIKVASSHKSRKKNEKESSQRFDNIPRYPEVNGGLGGVFVLFGGPGGPEFRRHRGQSVFHPYLGDRRH